MNTITRSSEEITRPLRLIAILWIAYLLVIAVVDRVLVAPIPWHFIMNLPNALLVLALSLWTQLQEELDKATVPAFIVLLSAVPLLINHSLIRQIPPNPATTVEGRALRLLPVLFMALVLTAWRYRWPQVVLFTLGTTSLELLLLLLTVPFGTSAQHAGLMVMLIRTTSFLIVGYFISTLMEQLRAQQTSLERANAQLLHYASTLENLTISRERNRMARELHDTLAHTLSGLSVQLEAAKAYWDIEPARAQSLLDTALKTTRDGLHETRRALKSLRASPLEDLGLLNAISEMTESAGERAGLSLDLHLPEELPALPPDVEQCIYRVTQEALANVVHHASATSLSVELSEADEVIVLTISDDGRGFAPGRAESGHYGIAGMRERAQLAGGRLEIESRPGQGTTVRFTVKG